MNYRLRDWLLSRQRFWGCPIPIVHCPVDGEVAVPEDQLPVVLPELKGADLKPKGVSPLAAAEEWVNVDCPHVRRPGQARLRHDGHLRRLQLVLPALLLAARRRDAPFDPAVTDAWMPADLYVGGVEHAVLHLLYARFFTKALRDMGLLEVGEPFAAQLNQGVVINQGRKMSKSLGNGVNLGDQLAEYGVDAVRLTLVFAGPPEDDIDWADMSPAGSLRFLQRAWRLSGDVTSEPGAPVADGDVALRRVTHHTLHDADRAGGVAPVQRDGRPHDGAGERHPQGDRLRLRPGRPRGPRGRRDRRDPAVAGGAVHRGGDVGAPGPRADGRAGRLARPSTRRCWSRSR